MKTILAQMSYPSGLTIIRRKLSGHAVALGPGGPEAIVALARERNARHPVGVHAWFLALGRRYGGLHDWQPVREFSPAWWAKGKKRARRDARMWRRIGQAHRGVTTGRALSGREKRARARWESVD